MLLGIQIVDHVDFFDVDILHHFLLVFGNLIPGYFATFIAFLNAVFIHQT